jgi:hypothetical protein
LISGQLSALSRQLQKLTTRSLIVLLAESNQLCGREQAFDIAGPRAKFNFHRGQLSASSSDRLKADG